MRVSPQPLLVAGRRPQSSHRSPYHLDAGEIMLLVVMCVVVPCCHVLCRHMKMQTAGLFKTWSRFFFVVERGILEAFSGEHVCCPPSYAMQLSLNNCMARLAPHLFSRPALPSLSAPHIRAPITNGCCPCVTPCLSRSLQTIAPSRSSP